MSLSRVGSLRSIAASASLALSGAMFVYDGLASYSHRWLEVAAGAAVMSTGLIVRRATPLSQAIGRGIAWSVVLPTAAVGVVGALNHFMPSASFFAPGGAALLGLVLARPMLRSENVRAEFSPVAFRSTLFSAATLSVALASLFGLTAVSMMTYASAPQGFAFGGISLGLLAAGIGVARMRAWGIAAGAVTSLGAVVSALAVNHFLGWPIASAALPGFAMVMAIVLARAGIGVKSDARNSSAARASFEESSIPEAATSHVRVSTSHGSHDSHDAHTDHDVDAERPTRLAERDEHDREYTENLRASVA